jgi:hypothetical protein
MVGFAAGSVSDLTARVIGQHLTTALEERRGFARPVIRFIRARSLFSDSSGIRKSGEQCESSVVRAMEAAHGPSLQSGFA